MTDPTENGEGAQQGTEKTVRVHNKGLVRNYAGLAF